MSDDKPKTVQVEALEYHTLNGKEYNAGDTYDAPADLLDSLVAQRKAVPVERAAEIKTARKGSHPVEPMTTESMGKKQG